MPWSARAALLLAVPAAMAAAPPASPPLEPLSFVIRVVPGNPSVDVEAVVPTSGQASVELMMPVWTPGYFVQEDFASRIQEITAVAGPGGGGLSVERTRPNRFRVATGGAPRVLVRYRLLCKEASVSLNMVAETYALLNGSGTYLTLVEPSRRPHDVRLELPAGWTSATGLAAAPDGGRHHFRAADFEELADSPILAGTLAVREFKVDGRSHAVVTAGDFTAFDGGRAARELERMARATREFWGFLPFDRYVFLLVFRPGGGGLEHRDSTMVTANPERVAKPEGYRALVGLITHEYFHAFNAKRLRPVELGPFDFESPPRVTSLWFPEGVTSYYTDLMLRRAGLRTPEDLLSSLSRQIGRLQASPGRLKQTVEQSSAEVWTNSLSGINARPDTVSYYVKGQVIAFLLDARIRRASGGARSLDDLMRLAYRRHGGDRGFTGDELRRAAEEVAGADLEGWFQRALASTEELDYAEALDWFGLRFAGGSGGDGEATWRLEARPDATETQKSRLREWLRSDSPSS